MRSFFGTLIRRTANSIWQISAHKFGLNYVGEIEWQNFCRTLCTGIFSLGTQRLVKLTPEVSQMLLLTTLEKSNFLGTAELTNMGLSLKSNHHAKQGLSKTLLHTGEGQKPKPLKYVVKFLSEGQT
jgi:hypothetical protein